MSSEVEVWRTCLVVAGHGVYMLEQDAARIVILRTLNK